MTEMERLELIVRRAIDGLKAEGASDTALIALLALRLELMKYNNETETNRKAYENHPL